MKRKFNLRTFLFIVLGSTTLAACAASVAYTFTWFSNQENLGKDVNGQTDGAYFARGSGTEDDPYVINRPFHLYNLAWLQYTGYFGDKECYFIIEKDLDMTGWTLPPIGTTDHPFIGHLDGNDATHSQGQEHAAVISNLTISNQFSDYNRHPGAISSVSNVNIMGFFGVVGKIGNDYSSVASSTVPSVKNLYLNNVAVNDKTANTLIGIAAGYVNGVVENVGIAGDSSLSVPSGGATAFGSYTTNVSDYTSVGYCEKEFRSSLFNKEITMQASTPVTGTKPETGSGTDVGWGGSVDMKTMYNHIKPLYTGSTVYSYPTETNVSLSFDEGGNAITSESTKKSTSAPYRYSWPNGNGYDSYNSESYNGNTTAQYSFVKRKNGRTINSNFLYLSGNLTRNFTSSLTKNITPPNSPSGTAPQTISDGNGNYLALGQNGLVNSTSSSTYDTAWYIEDNFIYTYNPYQNFAKVYLYDDNGTLSVSSSAITAWTYSTDGNTLLSSNQNYLAYYLGNWTLTTDSEVTMQQYIISYYNDYYNETYYLSVNSGSPYETNYSTDAAKFYVDGQGYFYTLIDNKIAYLILDASSIYSSSWYSYASVKYSSTIDTAAFKQSGSKLVANYSGKTWYFYSYNTAYDGYGTTYTFDTSTITVTVNSLSFANGTAYSISGLNSVLKTQSTYFPLSFDTSSTSKVSSKNTGYVVSGAYESSSIKADIRVSQYNLTDISKSTTSSAIDSSKVYTINDSGSGTISDTSSYEKFADSLASMNSIISSSSDSYIYGLHFMNASISKDHLITAPYVSINGKDHSNYELPEDSIDFRLRDKGYINFFAGTYYSGNDSFFSLHRIFRNEDSTIADIKEISKVYRYTADATLGKRYAYVYQYTDGTYSAPYWLRNIGGKSTKCQVGTTTPMTDAELNATTTTAPTGYTSIFDTSWIKKQGSLTTNAVYYFEVPVNEGEFALGSVTGGTGAYLMYLDIGANAQRTDRTTINEIKTTNTYEYAYPNGVSFVDSTTATVTASDSVGLTLSPSTYQGAISVKRTDTTVAYTNTSNTGISACFIGDSVTLTGNGTTITTETYVSLVTETEKTQTILDYNTSTDEETKTVYKEDKDGNKTTQINDGNATSGWGDADVEIEAGTDGWHTEAVVKNVYVNGKSVTVTVNSTYAYTHDETENTYYYSLTGYQVTVKGDVEVKVTATQVADGIVVSLLTDATNNTYTTLVINVPQTIAASS